MAAGNAKELCGNVTLISQFYKDLIDRLTEVEERVEIVISLLHKSEEQINTWKHRLRIYGASNISSVGTGLFISGIAGAVLTSGASLGLTIAGCLLIGVGAINTETIPLNLTCDDEDHLKREFKWLKIYCQNANLSCENLVTLSKTLENWLSAQSWGTRSTIDLLQQETEVKQAINRSQPVIEQEICDYEVIKKIHDSCKQSCMHSVSWESYYNASKDFTKMKEIIPVLESLTGDIQLAVSMLCALLLKGVNETSVSQDIAYYIQVLHTLKQKITLSRKCITYKMKLVETIDTAAAAENTEREMLMQKLECKIQMQSEGIVLDYLQAYLDEKIKETDDQLQSQMNVIQIGTT